MIQDVASDTNTESDDDNMVFISDNEIIPTAGSINEEQLEIGMLLTSNCCMKYVRQNQWCSCSAEYLKSLDETNVRNMMGSFPESKVILRVK